MPFEEDLKTVLGTVTDETLRATLLTGITKAHVISEAGLVTKRDELLNEVKSTKESLTKATVTLEAFGDRKPEDFTVLEESNKKLMDNPNDIEKLEQLEKKYTMEKDALAAGNAKLVESYEKQLVEKGTEIDKRDQEINSGLKERALTRALESVNVHPDFKGTLVDALANKVHVDIVNGERKVKIDIDNTPFDMDAGIDLWSKDEKNSKFISAVHNQGGGGNGSGGSVTLLQMDFNDMTITQKSQLAKENMPAFLEKKAKALGR